MMNRLRQRPCRGVTLLELVYVVLVMGILAAVLMPVVLNSLRAYEATRSQVTTLDQLRYATERMAREIREARFNASQEVEFSAATEERLVFTRRDLSGGVASEVVTLEKTGADLTLAYDSLPAPATGPQVLLSGVSRLELTYLDQLQVARTLSSPPTVTQLADVYAVRIVIEVLTPDGQTLSRQTVVQLKGRELI